MGGVAENTIQRRFTDMQGWVNQYIAEKADEVVLMVSGIGVKVKGYKAKGREVKKVKGNKDKK